MVDIQFEQGCMDCLGCTGTITIYSSDKTAPELKIEGLPNARELHAELEHYHGILREKTIRHEE